MKSVIITFSQRQQKEWGEWTKFKEKGGGSNIGWLGTLCHLMVISKNAENKILEICQGSN